MDRFNGVPALSIAILSVVVTFVVSGPAVQVGTDAQRREDYYGPARPAFFPEGYLDENRDPTDQETRPNLDRQFNKIAHASGNFDIASDPTIFLVDDSSAARTIHGRPAGLLNSERALLERFVKRNIDEIDRTAFDNFFKRNTADGWSELAKKLLTDYLIRNRSFQRHG